MANNVQFNIRLRVDGKEQVAQLTVATEQLREAVDKSKSSWQGVMDKIARANFAFQGLQSAVSGITSSLNELTAESRSFGGAMAAANTMAGKSGEEFSRLKDQVAELSKQIPIARDELANGLYQVISNGVPEDNWISYLEKSAKASVGGIADLGETVKVTSTIIKNYGLEWDAAGDIQDKIQLTAKNGVTSFEQLAQALPRVTSQAATLDVSIDELMASFSTLTGVSGNTAEVSTQLAAIFTALIKPSSEAIEMAQQMGIQFDAASIKAAGGMEQFLLQLDKSVKQYAASSGMLEQEVYGKLFGSAESLRAITPLVGNLSKKFSENVAGMKDSAGTIEDAFDTMASTGAAKLQMLNNKLGEVSDVIQGTVGNALPYLNFASQLTVTASSAMQLGTAFKTMGGAMNLANMAANLWNATSVRMSALTATCSATMRGAAVSATTLRLAIQGLMIATGVGIAVAVLTTAIGYLTSRSERAKDGVKDLSRETMEAQQVQQQSAARLAEVRTELGQNISKLKNFKGSKEEEKKMVQQLNVKYGEAFGYYSTISQWYNALINDSKAYCAQLEVEAQIEARKNQIKKLAEKQMRLTYDEKGNKRTYTKTTYSGGGDYYTYTDQYGRKATGISRGKATTTTWTGEQTKGYQEAQNGINNLTKDIVNLQRQADKLSKNVRKGSSVNPYPATIAGAGGSGTSGGGTTGGNTVGTDKPDPLQGSIDWYNKVIEDKRKELQASADEATAKALNSEMEGLQRELYMLKVKVGVETPAPIEVKKQVKPMAQQIEEAFDDMQQYLKQHPLKVETEPKKLEELQKKLDDMQRIGSLGNIDLKSFQGVQQQLEAINGITDPTAKGFATAGEACGMLGGALQQLGADSAAAKAGMVMAAIGQLVLSFAQAMTSASQNWITWLAFGVSGTAQLISIIGTLSQFATGGIVGGNQKSGDNVLVRVNSGEMILNAAQQARLFALANGAAVYGASSQIQGDFVKGTILSGINVNATKLQGIIADEADRKPLDINLRLRGRDLVASVANETRSNRRRSNIKI